MMTSIDADIISEISLIRYLTDANKRDDLTAK